jgi:hypothetical protein
MRSRTIHSRKRRPIETKIAAGLGFIVLSVAMIGLILASSDRDMKLRPCGLFTIKIAHDEDGGSWYKCDPLEAVSKNGFWTMRFGEYKIEISP